MSVSSFPFKQFLLALLIGLMGALAFLYLRLPLPWMLGPMVFCTLASFLRAPVAGPSGVRPPMMAVIGVLLGSSFSPQVLDDMGGWIATLGGMAVFVVVAGAACTLYLRRVGRFDMVTAYFSGMPGGLVEMVAVGEARGGDARMIALIQTARIMLVVILLPVLVTILSDGEIGTGTSRAVSIFESSLESCAWLLGLGAMGAALGHVLRLPSPFLVGPMFVSAALHLAGLIELQPPGEIVLIAQLVLGVTLGCRFAGFSGRAMLRVLALAVGSNAIILALAIAFALVVDKLTGHGFLPLLLAYAPGGLTETGILAIALHVEVAFVTMHHLFRVIFVMVMAPLVFRLSRPK